ncbi:DNA repair protein RadA, partial [Amycolatopsis sp. NPDC000746]
MVKKSNTVHRCAECGYETAKWLGRCPECQAWGTLEERGSAKPAIARVAAGAPSAPARPIAEVDVEAARAKA